MSYIIGISGPSNSGKSYFTQRLLEAVTQNGWTCATVSTDEFYYDRSDLQDIERAKINFEAPDAINRTEFHNAVKTLKLRRDTKVPIYDFKTHSRKQGYRLVNTANLIIIEGIFSFSFDETNDLYDLKIYVDLSPDLCLIRKIQRDVDQRGRTIEFVINQYLNVVRPTQSKFVHKDINKADLIINGENKNTKVIELLINTISHLRIE